MNMQAKEHVNIETRKEKYTQKLQCKQNNM